MSPVDRLCFALDYASLAEAMSAAEAVRDSVGVFKVGLELYTKEGPRAVEELKSLGRRVFLDLKLHDIPATVAGAVGSAAALGVDYLTLHAAGGPAMMQAAAKVAPASLRLLGVTVLTSMDNSELSRVGIPLSTKEQVLLLGRLAKDSGLNGLVCSIEDAGKLRSSLGRGLLLVTPGVRPAGSEVGDQKRIGTPRSAVAAGSDLLVVGRPIREAPQPLAAARGIVDEIAAALSLGT